MKALILAAADLISDVTSDNPEYDRALVELVGTMVGADTGDDTARDTIYLILRAVKS